MDVIEVDHIDQDICRASEININNNEVLTIGDRHIKEFQEVDDASEQRSRDIANEQCPKNVKLPTIKLPTFDGSILQWQENFVDLFWTAIHQRRDVGNATKFHYLLSQLTGDASQLMVGFNRTDSEYEEAVLLLKQTYGNKNKLIVAHLFAIFDLNIT